MDKLTKMEEHDLSFSKKEKKQKKPYNSKLILIVSMWVLVIVTFGVTFLVAQNYKTHDNYVKPKPGVLIDTVIVEKTQTISLHIDEAIYDVSECNTISISVEDGRIIVTNND